MSNKEINKFKRGDKVTIIKYRKGDLFPLDTVVIVMENSTVPFVKVNGIGERWAYDQERLELYVEDVEELTPKQIEEVPPRCLEVGDSVKVIRQDGGDEAPYGTITKIKGIVSKVLYTLECDTNSDGCYTRAQLKLITDPMIGKVVWHSTIERTKENPATVVSNDKKEPDKYYVVIYPDGREAIWYKTLTNLFDKIIKPGIGDRVYHSCEDSTRKVVEILKEKIGDPDRWVVKYSDGKQGFWLKKYCVLIPPATASEQPILRHIENLISDHDDHMDVLSYAKEEFFKVDPAQLGADQSITAIMPPVNNKLKPEKTMVNFKITKHVKVNGTDVDDMSEDGLIAAITEAKKEEKRLIDLDINSKLIDSKIAEANAFVVQATTLLDKNFKK